VNLGVRPPQMHQLFRLWKKRPPIDESFIEAIGVIRWFDKCGHTAGFDIPIAAEPVHSWNEAMAACESQEGRDAMLEARNQLTSFLCAKYPKEDQRWNEVTDEAKRRCVTPLSTQVWQPFAQKRGYSNDLVHSTQWNVLAAIMEHEYEYCIGRPAFFLYLLEVYRSGHFPCGWVGSWPSGKLLYY
ncbi:hypothetical protein, partial [Aquabacterium soli]|uniref:hypothetical protein n=1 Tax=Aquabacterium soli TaxID=2493092 RepID=UPI001F2CCD92